MINKQIHSHEIKLRLLLTNECNRHCNFCLNDFQEKSPIQYLDYSKAFDSIVYYSDFFNYKVPLQVYLSGGEPTLHPDYLKILELSKKFNCRTTLCSNGYNLKGREFIDCLHIGTYEDRNNISVKFNGDVQCVYSKRNPYVTTDFIKYFLSKKIKVKVFSDFFEEDLSDYYKFMEESYHYFGPELLNFRFTGVQENRGIGCKSCNKRCITLKAIWVFPDGGISACPQLYKFDKEYPTSYIEWIDLYSRIYDFHKLQ